MSNSKRKCKHCKEYTDKWIKHPGGTFCDNMHCAIEFAMANRSKGEEKKRKEKTKQLKKKLRDEDRSYWMKKAQASFNAYIRFRDKGSTCISCGRMPNFKAAVGGSGIQAGHYRSVGACPELRFEELNVHIQCVHCNVHKSGNAIDYRVGLINKIGIDKVEWIEGPHEPKKYTIDELKEIDQKYRRLVKDA